MRPVNLIPPEERRGEKTPLRAGPLSYVIVAVLTVALLGVTLVVLTSNQISDRKAEKTRLQAEVTAAQARAKQLSAFAQFAALQQARQATVTSLATSRFDWERVLRELAIVIPNDVWLTELTATASADSASTTSSSATSSAGTEGILGPSLDIQGCGQGHDAVASFLAAVPDIDGVTRVTVISSQRSDSSDGTTSTSATAAAGAAGACSGNGVSTFELVAAFDNAQTSAAGTSSTAPPTLDSAESTQVADGRKQLQQQNDSTNSQISKAHGAEADNTFIPGTGTTP